MAAPDADSATHKVGPFEISRTENQLVLRQERRGELSLPGCLMFVATMMCILVLGLLSILHTHETTANGTTINDPTKVFSPQQNHFGFLWLTSSIAMMVLVPLYVVKAYNSALVFAFRRSDDSFLRGNRKVARLRKIEYVSIRETKDPDQKYIYLLSIVYNDGQQMLLHEGYEERDVMNLANEISGFIHCPVKWKQKGMFV